MKGSEKQIKWAVDIIDTAEDIMKNMEAANQGHEMYDQVCEMHKRVINNMKQATAWDIIDDFHNIKSTGNVNDDYILLTVCIKMAEHIGRKYR